MPYHWTSTHSYIIQILTGQIPFFDIKSDIAVVFEVVLKGARPIRPNDEARITDTVWTLLEACWSENPAARPNSSSVALILDLIAGARVGLDASAILKTNTEKSGTDIMSRRGQDEYYSCHFSDCCAWFSKMDECIDHECAEYLNVMMSRYMK